MVFRKPYAFLIKNFKKIHIVLLLLCSFIFYKTIRLGTFIDEFTKYLSYDPYLEPITRYTSFFAYISLIIILIFVLSLIVLLKRKNKPWKLYLIPLIAYTTTIFVFVWSHSYFSSYSGELVTKTAITINGFILLARLPQYATFIILFIRITGLDFNKFSFQTDKEYLEMDEEDKAEFEVSVDIDKYALKRLYKKTMRSLYYYYEEHKWFVNIVGMVVIALLLFTSINYFLAHKTTNEGGILNANGYSIRINDSYYTNKNQKGEVLEEDSSFVILNLTIKNNASRRKLNTSNFHLVNGREDITFSGATYVDSFIDIGKKYRTTEFKNGEERTFAMIFKVDKKLNKDNFVLYYQEYKSSRDVYLRKIKLNLIDLSQIITENEKKIKEGLKVKYPDGTTKNFKFTSISFVNQVDYNIESCNKDFECSVITKTEQVDPNYKILKIDFVSNDFEGKELIDFSNSYGKIIYVDKDGIRRSIDIVNILEDRDYLGKNLYIKVPNSIETSTDITFIYTIRNHKYLYKIR